MRTLQERIEEANREFWRGRPLQVGRIREIRGMMAEDPETMEDYTLSGWRKSEFTQRAYLEDWAHTHLPKAESEEAKDNIMKYGQTAVLHVRDNHYGFMRIDLEPVKGRFWFLVPQWVIDGWKKDDWHPHISMTYESGNTVDGETFESVRRRWDGKTECIKIASVTQNGALMLREEGIGNDWQIWKHYIAGTYKGKWEKR